MSASILVTDGEQRAALATVRALGRAGYRVHVVSSRPGSLAAASRFAASEAIAPDPLSHPESYAAAVATVAERLEIDVLLPMSEAALLCILPDRGRFTCAIPFPAADDFQRICDKGLVLRTAATLGLHVPAQFEIASRNDADARDDLPFPLVLKPSRSVVGDAGERIKTSVLYAGDRPAFLAAIASLPDAAFPVLCQQRIAGPGTAISLLLWEGDVRAAFAHRRMREKPPSGGVSVLRESIPLDADLTGRSVALLRAFHWQGVAMVEYKVEAATGHAYLMEVNGRFWGSLQLAIDAGVDFPVLLVESALGRQVTPVLEYPPHVRTRWEWGDVDHLVARLRRSPEALSLPAGAPSRLAAVTAFLRGFAPGIRSEVFARDDMRPFLRESADWVRRR